MARQSKETARWSDTIAAVASPPGCGPRGIVRISGGRAIEITDSIFHPAPPPLSQRKTAAAASGLINLGGGAEAPARVYLFRGPRTYTVQDICEIHATASPPLLQMILKALLDAGARLAEPGEFTRRAFLNGRLRLNQAEAVLRVIQAAGEADLKLAVSQLSGHATREIARLHDSLVRIASRLELDIDFSDQETEITPPAEVLEAINRAAARIERILAIQSALPISEEGISVAITGPPNAGKSTLFNALLGTDAAIVCDLPGTTRDAVTARVTIDGVTFRLTDTPGLGQPAGPIEAQAQVAAHAARREAAIEIVVLDGSVPDISPSLLETFSTPHRSRITVINKCDLARSLAWEGAAIRASALTGEGVADVKRALSNAVRSPDAPAADHAFVPNARHRAACRAALQTLAAAREAARGGFLGSEFVAFDLRAAADALKEITGEITTDEILDRIFCDFCIGK